MSGDAIRAAFGPLAERAALLAPEADRISLRDHVRSVEVGAFESERGATQRLRFDVVVEVVGREVGPGDGDDVDRILSYDRITDAIDAALAEGRAALLETLAERVAAGVLREPAAARAFVRVEKLDRGPGALGVEIVRAKGEAAPAPQEAIPAARIAVLPAGSDAGNLAGLLVIIAEAAPGAPRAATPEAQARIDLLALDQAAWALGARHDLPVVGTRAEMERVLRAGAACAWAPARMALDAAGGLPGTDAASLGRWLARLIGAPAP